MRNIRERNILHLPGMEPWRGQLDKRKLALLERSWAGIFRREVLPSLPVERLGRHYSGSMGRKSKELLTVMGALVLQQMHDLTDEETRAQLAFNQQWHYALDTFDPKEQVISLKTLWTARNILVREGISREIFQRVTDRLIESMGVETKFQRLDSVHIQSDMARLGRVRLMARVITVFLRNMKRQHGARYSSEIPARIKLRYWREGEGYFGEVKPSGARRRLGEIGQDLYWLVERYKSDPEIRRMYSFKMLERVLREQCRVRAGQVEVVPSREVPNDSLQNPSDIDAGYDGYKGQGYKVQLMESYSRGEGGKSKGESEQLNLITYVEVEPAHKHDSKALEPALEEVEERGVLPKELLADAAYGSEENVKRASEKGVELIAPVPGKKPRQDLSGFSFDEESKEVRSCPRGHSPELFRKNKKGTFTAIWSKEVCSSCPLLSSCPVKLSRRGYRLWYKEKLVVSHLRRQREQSLEFQKKYRYRRGIEGSISAYDRRTGVKRLRYRGLLQVSYAARLKALGINIFRAARAMSWEGDYRPTQAQTGQKWSPVEADSIVRFYFRKISTVIFALWIQIRPGKSIYCQYRLCS